MLAAHRSPAEGGTAVSRMAHGLRSPLLLAALSVSLFVGSAAPNCALSLTHSPVIPSPHDGRREAAAPPFHSSQQHIYLRRRIGRWHRFHSDNGVGT